jgi:gluconate 2-dehydrogenase gamma chain
MTSMSEWKTRRVDPRDENDRPRFFTDHEWLTIEAAMARIIPTDHDPGATEARAVRFLDRYLSGIDFIFASARGDGFLDLTGTSADAWRARVGDLQRLYRNGIRDLDALSSCRHGAEFLSLAPDDQDEVLVQISGAPMPATVSPERGLGGVTIQVYMFDDGLSFFDALVMHTRQGFYGDPVYGGNHDKVGWTVIGFPGPESLADTIDGTYSLREYYLSDYDWEDLIPHLRQRHDVQA